MHYKMGRKWRYWLGAILFFAIVLWGLSGEPVASQTDYAPYALFHEGWSQVIDGETIPLEDIHDFQHVSPGEDLVFTCTLPPLKQGKVLLIYSANQEVSFLVGNQVAHNFAIQDQFVKLKTPGSAWNQIDLTTAMSGMPCTMTISSPIPRYANTLYDIYFINNVDVDSVRTGKLWFRSFNAFAIFVLMLAAFTYCIVWKNPKRRWYFCSLGLFYLYFLLGLLGNLNFFDIFTGRPIVSYLIQAFFMRLLPLTLWRLAINSTDRYDHPRFTGFLGILATVDAILPWALLLLFGIAPLDVLWFHNLTAAVVMVGLLVVVVQKILRYKTLDKEELPCLPIIILLIGCITDYAIYLIDPGLTPFTGCGFFLGCALYTATTHIILGRTDSKNEVEKVKIQRSYERLQITSMMEQIKAHFIFNTLNAISAMCKYDPKQADHAIHLFASYMRGYMYLTNQHEVISFSQELKLVKAYLSIEKIRFEDVLTFQLETDFQDFDVPPLSVQPLVENAVVHGIRGQLTPGKIIVETKRVGNTAQVIISDSGAGFDTTSPYREGAIGITNVQKRLEVMSGGSLQITSQVGVGTQVVMTIPLGNE